MAIVDVFTYNGEADILEIRLNILSPHVDQFIIVEAPTTFSGLTKPLYYEAQKERFKEFWPKIKYFVVSEDYAQEEVDLAQSSPNTQGATHWKREFLQKESIKKALTHLKDEDIVFISDVDEIWMPYVVGFGALKPVKLRLKVYTYWLNNRSSENFHGVLYARYRDIKEECLNHLRTNAYKTDWKSGWHFTSMGGYKSLEKKLKDSYTEESYATPAVLAQLEQNMAQSKDFLGRDFTYRIDESEWPQYLKENKHKYLHLCK